MLLEQQYYCVIYIYLQFFRSERPTHWDKKKRDIQLIGPALTARHIAGCDPWQSLRTSIREENLGCLRLLGYLFMNLSSGV